MEKNSEVVVKAATASWVKTGYGVLDDRVVAAFRNTLMNRPAWDQIDAVKNGRVYILSSGIWAGPRAPVGILYVAKWCYPELMRDIDPEALHRQWLKKWHHKELKGIYGYPKTKSLN